MKLSYPQKSALASTFILLIWELNLVLPEQKKYFTLASIAILLLILVQIQSSRLSSRKALNEIFSLKYWKLNLSYLILPLFLTVGTAALLKFVANPNLKQIIILFSFIFLYLIILHTHKSYAKKLRHDPLSLRTFILAKFYTAFIFFAASYGLLQAGRLSLLIACAYNFSFAIIFFYKSFKDEHARELIERLLGVGILAALGTYLSSVYELSLFLGAIFVTTSYYVAWGVFGYSKRREPKLEVSLEYLLIGLLILVIIMLNRTGQIL